MKAPFLQQTDPGCAPWAVRARGADLAVSLIGWDPRLVPEYLVRLSEDDARVVVDVRQSREQADGEFWSASGHPRRAAARLAAPLAGRAVVDLQGLRLPVADADALLEPPAPWDLVHEEYQHGPAWAWASTYSDGGRQVHVRQGTPALAEIDWARTSFTPVLLDRPRIRDHRADLVTFNGDEGNFQLAWHDSDRTVVVQAMSAFAVDELVRLAQGFGPHMDRA